MLTMKIRRVFVIYYAVASVILMTIVIGAYFVSGIMYTDIMLGGWDTPFYAWDAKIVIQYGPWYLMQLQSYSKLYTELLAFVGFIIGSVVIAQRLLPVVLGMLEILLFMVISYQISKSVNVAGVTAILTPLSVGTLHLISEYHRNHLTYVLGLSTFLLLASKPGNAISKRRYLLVFLLLLTMAATQFEAYALFSLILILAAFMIRDWKRLVTLVFCASLASGIIVLIFPDFLNRYILTPTATVVRMQLHPDYMNYGYLVFWTIGSWLLLPIAFFGLVRLYHATRREETRAVSLPVFVLSTLLILFSFVFVHIRNLDFNNFAARGILVIPIPIILALGIEPMAKVIRRASKKIKQKETNERNSTFKEKEKKTSKTTALLSVLIILSLALTSYEAAWIILVPYVQVSGYSKIVAVRQYLQNYTEAPIFMFNGSSLWNSDVYRAYIGIEIGEHLAYFGDLENLIELRPTIFQFHGDPERVYAWQIANFTSVRYLEDMLGNKKYMIYPQKAFVRNVIDLRLHPLVYIVPELWDSPVPSYIKRFRITEDIYVVPSLAEIEAKVGM